jgi:hypothetical protein
MHGYQRSPGRNIQGRGEFKEIFARLVAASHKNRNREWQSWPLPPLGSRFPTVQSLAPFPRIHPRLSHLWGQTLVEDALTAAHEPVLTLFQLRTPVLSSYLPVIKPILA